MSLIRAEVVNKSRTCVCKLSGGGERLPSTWGITRHGHHLGEGLRVGDVPWPDAAMERFRKQIVDEVTEQVAALIAAQFKEQSEEFRERHHRLEGELDLHQAISRIPRNAPVAGDLPPRPPAIDVACAADPDAGPQKVTVLVHGRRVKRRITPGSDPAAVWESFCRTVTEYYEQVAQ